MSGLWFCFFVFFSLRMKIQKSHFMSETLFTFLSRLYKLKMRRCSRATDLKLNHEIQNLILIISNCLKKIKTFYCNYLQLYLIFHKSFASMQACLFLDINWNFILLHRMYKIEEYLYEVLE